MHVIERLLASEEPAIVYKTATGVLGKDPGSPEMQAFRAEICSVGIARRLLSEQDDSGKLPYHPYAKWVGAHWVLACLADLEYPPGDPNLKPLVEQEYDWILGEGHTRGIKAIAGRVRRCASQEGNALFATMALGLADERAAQLADRLIRWQWEDGGWNCDKRPVAVNSSYHESLIPMRGLFLFARLSGDRRAQKAAERAAEVFLKRELFKRQRDMQVISPEFIRLHYPSYWHYDVLSALKVLAEAGMIADPRCIPALDLLESKRLPDGGFPAEKTFYRVTTKDVSGRSRVDWGGKSLKRMNEFVTVQALSILRASQR